MSISKITLAANKNSLNSKTNLSGSLLLSSYMFVRFKCCLQLRDASFCENIDKYRLVCSPFFLFAGLKQESTQNVNGQKQVSTFGTLVYKCQMNFISQ